MILSLNEEPNQCAALPYSSGENCLVLLTLAIQSSGGSVPSSLVSEVYEFLYSLVLFESPSWYTSDKYSTRKNTATFIIWRNPFDNSRLGDDDKSLWI